MNITFEYKVRNHKHGEPPITCKGAAMCIKSVDDFIERQAIGREGAYDIVIKIDTLSERKEKLKQMIEDLRGDCSRAERYISDLKRSNEDRHRLINTAMDQMDALRVEVASKRARIEQLRDEL